MPASFPLSPLPLLVYPLCALFLLTLPHPHPVDLWNTYGECANYGVINAAHTNAILDLNWTSDGDKLMSASTDKTGRLWDVESGECIRKFKGHRYATPQKKKLILICSGFR